LASAAFKHNPPFWALHFYTLQLVLSIANFKVEMRSQKEGSAMHKSPAVILRVFITISLLKKLFLTISRIALAFILTDVQLKCCYSSLNTCVRLCTVFLLAEGAQKWEDRKIRQKLTFRRISIMINT